MVANRYANCICRLSLIPTELSDIIGKLFNTLLAHGDKTWQNMVSGIAKGQLSAM